MSNLSPYSNGPGYPPPPQSQYPHSDVYKASYDDLVDEHAEPYSKTSQHQTFTPVLGSAAQKPSFMAKQSYSSEMSGKDWDEESYMPSSTPRILPLKEEPVADTRTLWQKVYIQVRPNWLLANTSFSRYYLSPSHVDFTFAQSLCRRSST